MYMKVFGLGKTCSWNFEGTFTLHHVSCVRCHMSGIMCQVSHVTFFLLGTSGGASRWRVCYQWRLHRLFFCLCWFNFFYYYLCCQSRAVVGIHFLRMKQNNMWYSSESGSINIRYCQKGSIPGIVRKYPYQVPSGYINIRYIQEILISGTVIRYQYRVQTGIIYIWYCQKVSISGTVRKYIYQVLSGHTNRTNELRSRGGRQLLTLGQTRGGGSYHTNFLWTD